MSIFKKVQSKESALIYTLFVGFGLLFMIIETQSRYSYIISWAFVLLAMQGVENMVNWLRGGLNEYKKHIEQFTDYKDWMCADTFDGNINMLSIEECHKTKSHEFTDVKHFKTTIAHEFVHICHQELQQSKEDMGDAWFWEALATNLGNPEQFNLSTFNTTSEELINKFNDISYGYGIAYTIGKHMLSTYDQETILNYVKNPKLLIQDTPRLIEETKEYIKTIKKI